MPCGIPLTSIAIGLLLPATQADLLRNLRRRVDRTANGFLQASAFVMLFVEGSLDVKLPTIWRDEKAVSRETSRKRKDQKKEDAGARKGRKVAKHCVFFVVLWLRRVEK